MDRARAKAGGAERLLKELRRLEAPAPSEPGCISYELFQLADNPLEFMLHETWESPGHLQAHLGSAEMQAFFGCYPIC